MYLITNKTTKKVMLYGNNLIYLDNGYPCIEDFNTSFLPDEVNIYQNIEIPTKIVPNKYCYTPEQGFYLNPNYIEPDPSNIYRISDNVYHNIIDDYTEELIKQKKSE